MDDESRSLARIRNETEYQKAAGWLLSLDQRVKAVKKALRGYSSAYGPQDVNGEVFGFYDVKASSQYAIGAVVDAIREGGEEPSALVSFSSLKAELKRLPWLMDSLRALTAVIKAKSPRFTHKALKATLKTARPAEEDDDEEGGEE
jgi:hypothetical protein